MKAVICFIFFIFSLAAMDADYWSHNEPFSLKKDEFIAFNVNNNPFTIRWSLFHNKGLVTHIKYDHFPYQALLYDDYKLNAVKIPIKTNETVVPPLPYIMVVFEGFDTEKNHANMRLYLFDQIGNSRVERLE